MRTRSSPSPAEWELARHLYSAGALCCTASRGQVHLGGLASGGWGVALALDAFAERIGVVAVHTRLTNAARRYASQHSAELLGRGLFTGAEGRALVSDASTKMALMGGNRTVLNWGVPGDLMDGPPGIAWARFCVGFPGARMPEQLLVATKPGLAHGQLVSRALPDGAFAAIGQHSEQHAAELTACRRTPGWCNGLAGVAVAFSTPALLAGDSDARTEVEASVTSLLACDLTEVGDLGLCHGLLGVAVVLAGAGRLYSWTECTVQADRILDAVVDRLESAEPSDWQTNLTWLTGAAGILWGFGAVARRPRVNPLFPLDSIVVATTHSTII